MRHREYQRIAGEIAELEARAPIAGSADAQLLDLLRKRLQVHDAMESQNHRQPTPPPDTDGMIRLFEKVFRP